MRGEGEIGDARAVGQDHRDRRRLAPLAPPRFQDVADGARTERIPLEGERDGGRQFLRPIVVEQRVQPDQMRPEHVTAISQAREEGRGDRDREAQAIARA